MLLLLAKSKQDLIGANRFESVSNNRPPLRLRLMANAVQSEILLRNKRKKNRRTMFLLSMLITIINKQWSRCSLKFGSSPNWPALPALNLRDEPKPAYILLVETLQYKDSPGNPWVDQIKLFSERLQSL